MCIRDRLWGNPLYDWPVHKATGFAWWKQRMKQATSIYDVVRIDHFRGFESYYSIPVSYTHLISIPRIYAKVKG